MEINEESIKQMQDAGYVVRTAEQEKSFLQSQIEKEVGTFAKSHYDELDTRLNKLTGATKNDGEKTTEFLERAYNEKVKALLDAATDAKKSGKEFEGKYNALLDDKSGSDEVVKEYKDKFDAENAEKLKLKGINDQLNKDFTSFKEGIVTEQFALKYNALIEQTIASMRSTFKTFEEPKMLENQIDAIKMQLKSEILPVEVDGAILFKDSSGEFVQSKVDGHHLTMAEILAEKLAYLVDTTKKKSGLGLGNGAPKKEGDQVSHLVEIPAEVKTQIQLHDYLQKELKLDPMSAEFTRKFMATSEKNKLILR